MRMMTSKKAASYCAITMGAIFAAVICLYPTNGGAAASSSASENVVITITAKFSEHPIPIAVQTGTQFTITLPSNVTTGYSWRLAKEPDPKILKFVSSTYVESSGTAIGRGGTEVWTFQAVAKGSQTVKMDYARPWEKNASPAKSQTFAVSVQ